ncbi:hypothetical protein [Kosakonia cowanii]|uniref:hypothetical protein n=1 Tax=Kosakonia cowanii TaxID=208223 RepID=UPI0039B795AB
MNVKKVTASLVTTIILSVFTPLHAAPAPAFTPEQEARIGEIAADYLLKNPAEAGFVILNQRFSM